MVCAQPLFSATFRYALVCLLEIASSEAGINGADIARRHAISPTYLANVLSDLKRLGLVKSQKGRRGGYQLQRSPAEINLRLLHQGLAGSPQSKALSSDNPALRWLDGLEQRWLIDLEQANLLDLQRFAAVAPEPAEGAITPAKSPSRGRG